MSGSIGNPTPHTLVSVNRSQVKPPTAPGVVQTLNAMVTGAETNAHAFGPSTTFVRAAAAVAPAVLNFIHGGPPADPPGLTPASLEAMGARDDKSAFFQALLPGALASEKAYGIPASVILAQAAIESGWDQKPIGFNIFGIKGTGPAGTQLVATTEETKRGKTVHIMANFARYHSFNEAIQEHGKLYNNGYYTKGLQDFAKTKSPDRFIKLVASTYCTKHGYAKDVISIIDDYGLRQLVKAQGGH